MNDSQTKEWVYMCGDNVAPHIAFATQIGIQVCEILYCVDIYDNKSSNYGLLLATKTEVEEMCLKLYCGDYLHMAKDFMYDISKRTYRKEF